MGERRPRGAGTNGTYGTHRAYGSLGWNIETSEELVPSAGLAREQREVAEPMPEHEPYTDDYGAPDKVTGKK
jgi:hypothetical protein